MSFLDQLKTQAQALQSQRRVENEQLAEAIAETEGACRTILSYLQDLARHLTVIEPPGPELTLDGRTLWPTMKLVDFRVDARRKRLADQEVFDYIGMGWDIVPREGRPVPQSVSVNFPTDMQKVEHRLGMGPVQHERTQVRSPGKNVLQEVRYDYLTQTRGVLTATPDHRRAHVQFRLLNTTGFEVVHADLPAGRVRSDLLDELAKRIIGQPNSFL